MTCILSEIYIWLIEKTLCLQTENVGFNKSAWEKYPYHSPERGWGAKRAVDGLYSDLSATGGQCVISANEKSIAEWRVDLERIHIIHHIVIYYRAEYIDSGTFFLDILILDHS